MCPYHNEELRAVKLYFVLRSQDSSQDFSYELMFDFHDANDRQYFELFR
jgi:hypothetical protein